MSKFGDFLGSVNNAFQIGVGGTGERSLAFQNQFLGRLRWNPTANRTLVLPDRDGNVAIANSVTAGRSFLANVTVDAQGVVSAIAPYDPSSEGILWDHFFGSVIGSSLGVASAQVGTSAGIFYTSPGQTNPGAFSINTGTTATGNVSYHSQQQAVYLGSCYWAFRTIVRIPTLANSTDNFRVVAGLFNNLDGTLPTDGVYFVHENGRSLWCRTTNSSVQSEVSSGLTLAANGWVTLEIQVERLGAWARFFVGGTQVAQITTNIPLNKPLAFGWKITKTLGTAARETQIDYASIYWNLNFNP